MSQNSVKPNSVKQNREPEAETVVYCPTPEETRQYLQAFRAAASEFRFTDHAGCTAPAAVKQIVCWGVPPGFFAGYPAVQTVFALGAGVDKLVARPDLPAEVQICRLLDAGMAAQMLDYVLYGVLAVQYHFADYARQQALARWQPRRSRAATELRCTVLGAGAIGGYVARGLAARGHAVTVWSRQPKAMPGIANVCGWDALPRVFAHTDILIALLPSTAETRGLLNAERLAWLPAGASLINAGRGDLIDDAALLATLDRGQLSHAQLDVFQVEPLPPSHPFWQHPRINLTPHVAAQTLLPEAVAQIVANLRALAAGQTPSGLVDRSRQY